MVDFGLAQSFDKTSENIFEYESTKKSNLKAETPIKHNMISLSKKTISSTTNQQVQQATFKDSVDSPNVKEKNSIQQMSSSISFDSNLKNAAKETPKKLENSPVLTETIKDNVNQKDEKSNTPKLTANSRHSLMPTSNLQKYYSFQKSSYNISESKCTCFNMPFVCEICTTRFLIFFKKSTK